MTDTRTKTLDEQLLLAASMDQEQEIIKLINEGANVNARGAFNNTPLIFAVSYYCHSSIATLLKIPGIDIMAKDENGHTALYHASFDKNHAYRMLSLMSKEQIKETHKDIPSVNRLVDSYHEEIAELKGNIFRSIFNKSMQLNAVQWQNAKKGLEKGILDNKIFLKPPKWCPDSLFVKLIQNAIDMIDNKNHEYLPEPNRTIAFLAQRLKNVTLRPAEGDEHLTLQSKESNKSRIKARL